MSKPAQRQEIEIKLPVPALDALRARLKRLHAREMTSRTYESNTLYDTRRHDLRRRGQIIRIRIEQPPSHFARKTAADEDASTILTYKGPAIRSREANKASRRSKRGGHYKIKREVEVQVASPTELARILDALGYRPVFRYEKFRTTYAFPGIPGLKIELDETPIGIYLELEGPAAGIDRAAHLLGHTREDYLTASYGALYFAACRRRGQKPGDMLFPPLKKSR